MGKQAFRKYMCFVMVIVLFTVSVTGFCRTAHSFDFADPATIHSSHFSPTESSPCCPIDDHSGPDHCDSSCYCACHAALMSQPLQIMGSQLASPLMFVEAFRAIPEVYLPKYIPPHILA